MDESTADVRNGATWIRDCLLDGPAMPRPLISCRRVVALVFGTSARSELRFRWIRQRRWKPRSPGLRRSLEKVAGSVIHF